MINRQHNLRLMLLALGIIISVMACNLFAPGGEEQVPPRPTNTPTPESMAPILDTPSPKSACEGLTGSLEVMVLAGPAEVVGLEPYAIGDVPFAVVTATNPYQVQGGGPISFSDILVEEWGTYEVTLNFQNTIEGVCAGDSGSEKLHLTLEMNGEQDVIVEAEGFSGEYPWSGMITRELVFPLTEGAAMEGEGWAVVLHLNSR